MYNGATPIAGGIGTGVLATTGTDPILPITVGALTLLIGGALVLRSRWLQRTAPTA